MKRVLFICVHNSGRSQMAEAFLNRLAGGRVAATSAGAEPAERVNPFVVQVMREAGIDIGGQRPKMLTPEMLDGADRVITMGCDVDKACPGSFVPTTDWELADPEGKPLETVRRIRDEIRAKVEALIAAL